MNTLIFYVASDCVVGGTVLAENREPIDAPSTGMYAMDAVKYLIEHGASIGTVEFHSLDSYVADD